MGLYKTRGIIFKSLKYGDSRLIVDIYTLEKGLRSFILGLSRSVKSSHKSQLFQIFNQVEIVAYDGPEDKLCHIKEVSLGYHYKNIYEDIIKSSLATFMIELARNTIKEKEENPGLFHFLCDSFKQLDAYEGKVSNFHLKFAMELSSFAGFYPPLPDDKSFTIFDLKEGAFTSDRHLNEFRMNEKCSNALIQILSTEKSAIHEIIIDSTTRTQLLEGILKFFTYHLEGFKNIKSIDVLKTILG